MLPHSGQSASENQSKHNHVAKRSTTDASYSHICKATGPSKTTTRQSAQKPAKNQSRVQIVADHTPQAARKKYIALASFKTTRANFILFQST